MINVSSDPNKAFSGKIREARDAIREELASDLPPFKTGLYLHVLYETEAQLSHLLYIGDIVNVRLEPEPIRRTGGEEA